MKRDWDLVREILEKVEDGSLQTYLSKENFIDKGITEEDIFGHIEIMLDAGILKNGIVSRGWGGKFSRWDMQGIFISMQGHDLLDALRDQTVWMRIRQKARQSAVSISWEFIKAAIPVVMNELLKS